MSTVARMPGLPGGFNPYAQMANAGAPSSPDYSQPGAIQRANINRDVNATNDYRANQTLQNQRHLNDQSAANANGLTLRQSQYQQQYGDGWQDHYNRDMAAGDRNLLGQASTVLRGQAAAAPAYSVGSPESLNPQPSGAQVSPTPPPSMLSNIAGGMRSNYDQATGGAPNPLVEGKDQATAAQYARLGQGGPAGAMLQRISGVNSAISEMADARNPAVQPYQRSAGELNASADQLDRRAATMNTGVPMRNPYVDPLLARVPQAQAGAAPQGQGGAPGGVPVPDYHQLAIGARATGMSIPDFARFQQEQQQGAARTTWLGNTGGVDPRIPAQAQYLRDRGDYYRNGGRPGAAGPPDMGRSDLNAAKAEEARAKAAATTQPSSRDNVNNARADAIRSSSKAAWEAAKGDRADQNSRIAAARAVMGDFTLDHDDPAKKEATTFLRGAMQGGGAAPSAAPAAGAPAAGAPAPSDADLQHTAKLHGISVDEVKRRLGAK